MIGFVFFWRSAAASQLSPAPGKESLKHRNKKSAPGEDGQAGSRPGRAPRPAAAAAGGSRRAARGAGKGLRFWGAPGERPFGGARGSRLSPAVGRAAPPPHACPLATLRRGGARSTPVPSRTGQRGTAGPPSCSCWKRSPPGAPGQPGCGGHRRCQGQRKGTVGNARCGVLCHAGAGRINRAGAEMLEW